MIKEYILIGARPLRRLGNLEGVYRIISLLEFLKGLDL